MSFSTRVGKTDFASAFVIPNVISATGYDANDAMGSAFSAQLAVGDPGGLAAVMNFFDGGKSGMAVRVHLFSTAFSASPQGTAWSLAFADINSYLGYLEVGTANFVSAGNVALASVLDRPLPLMSKGVARTIYGQFQAVGNTTAFSASAFDGVGRAAVWASFGVLQD